MRNLQAAMERTQAAIQACQEELRAEYRRASDEFTAMMGKPKTRLNDQTLGFAKRRHARAVRNIQKRLDWHRREERELKIQMKKEGEHDR